MLRINTIIQQNKAVVIYYKKEMKLKWVMAMGMDTTSEFFQAHIKTSKLAKKKTSGN